MLRKKGDMTSTQIASLVLVIGGFIIVLIFLALFFQNRGAEKQEVCRLSVLTRATSPDVAQAVVPLKCTTEKICITTKAGQSCKQFAGEEDVEVKSVSNKRDIEGIMANAMYDCWSMMGQGKLDLFAKATQKLGGSTQATCVICSRIAFADGVIDSKLHEKIELDKYLQNETAPNSGKKYLELFRGFPGTFASVEAIEGNSNIKKNDALNLQRNPGNDQVAFVFAQNKPEKWQDVLKNWGYVAVGSTFTLPGRVSRAVFLTPEGIVLGAGVVVGSTINAAVNQQAAAGYCGAFKTSDEKNPGGCSVVQGIGYNVQDINMLCPGDIQGTP